MENLQIRKDLELWSFEALLALFSSEVDKDFSFSIHFNRAQVRLYDDIILRKKGKAEAIHMAYLTACLEKTGFKGEDKERHSTYHRERFIRFLKAQTHHFHVYSKNVTTRKSAKLMEHMSLAHTVEETIVAHRDDAPDPNAAQKHLAFVRLAKALFTRKQSVQYTSDNFNIDLLKGNVALDASQFSAAAEANPILKGLLIACPGFQTEHPSDIHDVMAALEGIKERIHPIDHEPSADYFLLSKMFAAPMDLEVIEKELADAEASGESTWMC
jgi:hypothetical protein